MLSSIGVNEVNRIFEEKGSIEVTCEFCGQQYQFDQSDISDIFDQSSASIH
jgi:molecular chaperone Hsp33